MADLRKLGLDRMATGISKAVGAPRGAVTTGDITSGEIVSVTFVGSNSATANTSARRTGAIEIGRSIDADLELIEVDTTNGLLTVTGLQNTSGTITYWVF